jgi:hypothetical protein
VTGAASKLLEIGRLVWRGRLPKMALAEDSGCANAHSVLAIV